MENGLPDRRRPECHPAEKRPAPDQGDEQTRTKQGQPTPFRLQLIGKGFLLEKKRRARLAKVECEGSPGAEMKLGGRSIARLANRYVLICGLVEHKQLDAVRLERRLDHAPGDDRNRFKVIGRVQIDRELPHGLGKRLVSPKEHPVGCCLHPRSDRLDKQRDGHCQARHP